MHRPTCQIFFFNNLVIFVGFHEAPVDDATLVLRLFNCISLKSISVESIDCIDVLFKRLKSMEAPRLFRAAT